MSNRCAVYVRVSTDDQRDNGYSIDSQLRMIKEYCEKNDYLIVDVYNDAGHSGKDLMKEELTNHLISVSKSSENLLNILMESYKQTDERLSEKNKKSNHIEWAKLMNNYKNTAEEIILKEYIFI